MYDLVLWKGSISYLNRDDALGLDMEIVDQVLTVGSSVISWISSYLQHVGILSNEAG